MKIAGAMESCKRWPDNLRGLCLLLVFSLIIKGIVVAFDSVVNSDGTLYIEAAKSISTGDFRAALELYPMPLYPLAIAGMRLFVPDWVLAGQLISCLALSLALIPLYLLTRSLFGARAAFWAGAAFVLSPKINEYAGQLIRDPLFLFFLAWATCFAVLALERKRKVDFLLTTVFSIIAFLSRVEAVVFLPVFWAALLMLFLFRPEERRELALGGLFSFLPLLIGGVSLVALVGVDVADVNRIGYVADSATLFFKGDFLANYHWIYEHLEALEESLPKEGLPGWDLPQNFAEIARHYLWLIYLVGLLEYLAKVLFAPFLLLLLAGFAIRPLRRGQWLLIFLTAAFFMLVYVFHVHMNFITSRYLLAPAFLLYPCVGAGTERLRSALFAAPERQFGFALLLLLLLIMPVQKIFAGLEDENVAKVAGRWLAKQPDIDSLRWMSTNSTLPFYAGRGRNFVNFETRKFGIDDLESYALGSDVDLLTVEISREGRETLPEMKNFEIIRRFEGTKNDVIIYRRRQ